MRLTDISVRNLPAPASSWKVYVDDAFKGFGVRVTSNGVKSFVLTFGPERKRVTIGRYPVISLANARQEAKKLLAEATLGNRPAAIGLNRLVALFLAEKRETTRPRTFGDYARLLNRHFAFDAQVASITPQRLTEIFSKVQAPQERAHLINVAKMLFRFAELRGYTQRSPAIGFTVVPAKQRERVLSRDELRAIWHACPDDPFGTAAKLLMLTGQRRGEIAHISLEGDLATIPPAHTKNKRPHSFPVGETTRGLLAKDRTFNGWGKSKARLDKASGVSDWTFHDLRRTYATTLAELGTPPHVIEAILNHKSGIISGVAQTYNRFRYIEEMRMAVQNFEHHFSSILADGEADPLATCHDAAQLAR